MATWYAQNSSVNIDSADEWNSAANGSGSWLTWANLGASDILNANSKTGIAVNVNVTCGSITGAGGFIVSSGVTIAASIGGGAETLVTSGTGYTLTITGNISGNTASGKGVVNIASACTVDITGNITAANVYNNWGLVISAAATVTVTGNISAGSSASYGVVISTGTLTINGNVTGGTTNSFGVNISGDATVTITGDCTAGASAAAVSAGSSVACTITGNLICTATQWPVGGRISYTPASGNYIQCKTIGGSNVNLAPQLLDHQILSGVVNGTITGNRTDCPAAQALESASYGDPNSQTTGTYHEAAAAEVQSGVHFGAGSALTGTYSGGGGLPVFGGSIVR